MTSTSTKYLLRNFLSFSFTRWHWGEPNLSIRPPPQFSPHTEYNNWEIYSRSLPWKKNAHFRLIRFCPSLTRLQALQSKRHSTNLFQTNPFRFKFHENFLIFFQKVFIWSILSRLHLWLSTGLKTVSKKQTKWHSRNCSYEEVLLKC